MTGSVRPVAIGFASLALFAVAALADPRAALEGWLVAFLVGAGVTLGAFAWLCVARLTGGAWAQANGPALRFAASASPAHLLGLAPLLVGMKLLFPWAADPHGVSPDVARLYLAPTLFAWRWGVGLAILAALAVAVAAGWGGRALASFGLLAYALAVEGLGYDALLSRFPHVASSGMGVELAASQLLSALAVAMIAGVAEETAEDVGKLALAAALGVLYMETMTLVVSWYGDQPDRAGWYLQRLAGFRFGFAGLAFVALAAISIPALTWARVRRSVSALRATGGVIVVSVFAHMVWLVRPSDAFMPLYAVLALTSLAGFGGAISAALAGRHFAEAQHA